ncbi:MAG: hypothetical protein Q9202_001235 [Teloschistes flavicans]
MTVTILSLPYELLSIILEEAAHQTAEGNRFTYGVESLSSQRILRGNPAPDALRWYATDAIRRVNSHWHDWACQYALRTLYIRRWRGSERWMQSRELDTIHGFPSQDVVYRDPYLLLRKTGDLFGRYPALATSVHRIFFDGYYSTDTSVMIFNILKYCNRLEIVSLPWTMLRYGSEDDWSRILSPRDNGTVLSSLELLAVNLKKVQLSDPARQKDDKTLDSAKVNLGHLRRLKISGSSNLSPVMDRDLVAMSRTARLVDLHITNTTCLTSQGLLALIRASKGTLRVLEHGPLADPCFQDPQLSTDCWGNHMCEEIIQCPQLRSLAISLPTICSDLFGDASNCWMGDVQIKAAGICKRAGSLKTPVDAQLAIFDVLDSARRFMQTQQAKSIELNIQISLGSFLGVCAMGYTDIQAGQFIFEPYKNLVHANFLMGSISAAGSWPSLQYPSSKGPIDSYGSAEWAYSCITEEEFVRGVREGHVSMASILAGHVTRIG